tara:strand:+ start:420 stop:959 length:540 start_codon:yes stop_codon:yes gene_type:complete
MNDRIDLELYNGLLEDYFEILANNPNQENMTAMLGKVSEHRLSKKFSASVTNSRGSDAIVTKNNSVKTRNYNLNLKINDLLEMKSSATTMKKAKSKMRVCNIMGENKENKFHYVVIIDMRKDINRTFIIPHDVFYQRAIGTDMNWTQAFIWNEDYTTDRQRGENYTNSNTQLLLEYEVI